MYLADQPKANNELKALIIEQNMLVRDTVKSALLAHDISNVSMAINASEATLNCKKQSYDLFFISFDLAADKDGFYLLEELKFKGFINNTSTVVFLSADTRAEIVNCVVEMQPDDFWTKPIDLKKTSSRLAFLLNVKKVLFKPLNFADKKDYSSAMYHAERLLLVSDLKPYHPRLQKLIGSCLESICEYEEAEKYYRALQQKCPGNWVQIGLARCLLKLDKWTEAQKLTNKLKSRLDARCAAYDLMAMHYLEHNQFDEAYQEIQMAAKFAPRNIERNKRCWDLARLNHDRQGQHLAAKNMAKFAKNSIHYSQQMEFNVLRSSIDLASISSNEQAELILLKTQNNLNKLTRKTNQSAATHDIMLVLSSRIQSSLGNKLAAERILANLSNIELRSDLEDNLDLVKALHEVGRREDAVCLMSRLQESFDSNSFTGQIIRKYLKQELDEKTHIHFSTKELIDMASVYYKQGRLIAAYNSLEHALRLVPNSQQIAMSMLKVLHRLQFDQKLNNDQIACLHTCRKILDNATLSDSQKQVLNSYQFTEYTDEQTNLSYG